MKKPSVLVVFLTVFIDLIGFGIVLPLLPIYSRDFHAAGWLIGVIMASFSLMQFFFAPVWGRLSDRIGRRPVLLVSTAGASGSYVLFALGSGLADPRHALALLVLSRVFAGICGANITVAQAYIADITPPEKRSARMGLIGMAFGLGFIFGPALGGISAKSFGIAAPGWVAAGLCALNFFLTLAILPESWKPTSEHVAARPRLAQWLHTLGQPKIGLLVGLFFLATFCFTCFETTLGLLVEENFRLDTSRGVDARFISYLFAYCGVIGAIVQGGVIGRLVKVLGEAKIILASFVLTAVSLAMLPYLFHVGMLLLGLALLSAGSAVARPPIFGLISMLTSAHEQGETIGVAQSAGSLARIIGPIFSASLFDFKPAVPYLICAAVSLVAG
ncbi:MAG: MFS transporter, partial [Verrucomicrobia bacterium]|nr:MFS transporter [Verrucomicrobiota bacterium]